MPATPLRRTLSAPIVRFNSAPYPATPRRSPRQSRRRVLGDIDWWTVVGGQDHPELVPHVQENVVPDARVVSVTDAAVEPEDVTLFNVASDDQMALAPQPEYLAYQLEGLTLAPSSLAPQTPSRPRGLRREASLSPLLSSASSSSSFDSHTLMFSPLTAPDFGTPEATPRRTRTRRTRAIQRTMSESVDSLRAIGSRRRHFERVASIESIASRSFYDENAPIGTPNLFN